MDTDTIAFVACVLAAISGSVLYYRLRRKRREQFESVAKQLGLSFYLEGERSVADLVSQFGLFSRGNFPKFSNMLLGRTGEVDVAIFTYDYVSDSPISKPQHLARNVIHMRSASLRLPNFVLWTELSVDKNDIDFDSHPEFSKMFRVYGPMKNGYARSYRTNFFPISRANRN